MIHIWTKPQNPPGSKRPVVAVIDDDDGFRRNALRVVRRLDVSGVGLIDTTAALRWLALTKPAVVLIPRARVAEVMRVCGELAPDERPHIIATVAGVADVEDDWGDAEGALALVGKLLDAETLLAVVEGALQAGRRKKRVLLVDDDDDIRETFSILLEEEGYEVVPAPHGKAAWNALQAGLRPDVILLDLMMPVMTGQEMFARLQSSPMSSTPVVVITAGTDPSPGRAPVLRKPVDMRDLLAAVSRAAA